MPKNPHHMVISNLLHSGLNKLCQNSLWVQKANHALCCWVIVTHYRVVCPVGPAEAGRSQWRGSWETWAVPSSGESRGSNHVTGKTGGYTDLFFIFFWSTSDTNTISSQISMIIIEMPYSQNQWACSKTTHITLLKWHITKYLSYKKNTLIWNAG